jgi:hypothetical protein
VRLYFTFVLYFQGSSPEMVSGHFKPDVPDWEYNTGFDPVSAESHKRVQASWTTIRRASPSVTAQPLIFNHVLNGLLHHQKVPMSLETLPLRNPDRFVAGQLHQNIEAWDRIMHDLPDKDLVNGRVHVAK